MPTENNKKNIQEDTAAENKPTDAQLISDANGGNVIAAHDEAEKDIEKDPDFAPATPNDDLDEGETALLGDDENDLI